MAKILFQNGNTINVGKKYSEDRRRKIGISTSKALKGKYTGDKNPNWKGGKNPFRTKEYFRRQRKAVLELLGNKCVRCGFSDYRALQIDHVNGDGSKERRVSTGVLWNIVMRSFLNKENRYQLLCANCNWIKRCENNEVRGGVDIKNMVE